MEYVNYEKPRMRVVDLRSEQAIAAEDGNCMPQASQGKRYDFYYDVAGDGWFHIHVTSKNCSGKNYELYYIDNKNVEGVASEEAKQAAADEIAAAMSKGDKQAFSGA